MNKLRITKKKAILISITSLLIIAVVLPMFWPDASGKYSGIKKEAAQYAVSNAWGQYSGINYASIFGTIKISAEDVAVSSSDDKLCSGEFISSTEPGMGDHFLVKVAYRTIFGISLSSTTFHICRTLHQHIRRYSHSPALSNYKS